MCAQKKQLDAFVRMVERADHSRGPVYKVDADYGLQLEYRRPAGHPVNAEEEVAEVSGAVDELRMSDGAVSPVYEEMVDARLEQVQALPIPFC